MGDFVCYFKKAFETLEGKWTFHIINELFDGTKRFGQLRKELPGISPKTLSQRLKELEDRGILIRTQYSTIPPTVEYSLTEKGQSLKSVMVTLKEWGKKWG